LEENIENHNATRLTRTRFATIDGIYPNKNVTPKGENKERTRSVSFDSSDVTHEHQKLLEII